MENQQTPIQYKFSHSLNRNEAGKLTGIFFISITAKCDGIILYQYTVSVYSSELTPKIAQKMKAICDKVGERNLFECGTILHKTCDSIFELKLNSEASDSFKKEIFSAMQEIKSEL